MSKSVRAIFMCAAVSAILSVAVLAGCDSGSSSQATTPAVQTQQQSAQPAQQSGQSAQQGQQGQPPSGQGGMKEVIARAATILGVSESDLSTAFEAAMKEMGGGKGGPGGSGQPPSGEPPSGERPSGEPPSGQQPPQGGGEPPEGFSEKMKDVYAKVAASLGLTTEAVQSAFEQAQSELKK